MDYELSYREKHNLSESALTDAQRTLHFIAENMRMQKSISVDGYNHFQQAIEALGREFCEDTISRQAVLAIAEDSCLDLNNYDDTKEFCDEINDLPPVIPQPKIGRWIYTGDYSTDGMLKCSECGFEHDVSEKLSYCPNCKKRMI